MADAGALGLITTALVLGIRHGFDWDHLAAITDVTSTTATADAAELDHEATHEHAAEHALAHEHEHGGAGERAAHEPHAPAQASLHHHDEPRPRFAAEQRRALLLGSLYALGHATVVAILGTLALLFGAVLPDWVDDVMGPVVGATLLFLGIWVFVSLYQYVRHGHEFRLRSRWMLVFDGVRYSWRHFQARLHGHEHTEPLEMSSYGPRTAFGVGMIHGIGAETGTQVLLIAAVGGAAASGLGFPMLLAFVLGLLISNFAIVVMTSVGFVASQTRERIYVVVGLVAGVFSLVIGTIFLLGSDAILPALNSLLPF